MALRRIQTAIGRFYLLPDQERDDNWQPSSTTILDAEAKPGLMYWAASEEKKLCLESVRSVYDRLGGKVGTDEFLRELNGEIGTVRAHEKAKNKAADYGTKIHNWIESDIRREMGLAQTEKPPLPEGGELSIRSYRNFRRKNKLHMRLIEVPAYSVENGHGGTTDWVAVSRLYQRDVVGDWKTSKSMHGGQTLQAASYVMALKEMGTLDGDVDALVIRLPKENAAPEVEVKHIAGEVIPQLYRVFLAYREAWFWQHPDWRDHVERALEKEEREQRKAVAA